VAIAGEVVRMIRFCSEDQAPRFDTSMLRCCAQTLRHATAGALIEQPEDAVGHVAQDTHPKRKRLRRDFPIRIEAAVNERIVRKTQSFARRGLGNNASRVGRLIAAGQVSDLLVVMFPLLRWNQVRIGYQIVVPRRAERPRIRKPIDLNRRGLQREQARQLALAVAIDVDQNIDACFADPLRDRFRRLLRDVVKFTERVRQALAQIAAIVRRGRERYGGQAG